MLKWYDSEPFVFCEVILTGDDGGLHVAGLGLRSRSRTHGAKDTQDRQHQAGKACGQGPLYAQNGSSRQVLVFNKFDESASTNVVFAPATVAAAIVGSRKSLAAGWHL